MILLDTEFFFVFFSCATDMNDDLKIRALMIYFSHWGKEESRIQRSISGVLFFQHLVQTNYTNREENAFEVLTDTNKSSFHFWYKMIHTLLPEMNHSEEYYDYRTKPLSYKIKFAEMNGISFQNVCYSGLNQTQMNQIDAIVALPTLHE